jgi:hypothetical protein
MIDHMRTRGIEFPGTKEMLWEFMCRRGYAFGSVNSPWFTGGANGSVTMSEASGVLDNFNISWPFADPLEISAIAIRRHW